MAGVTPLVGTAIEIGFTTLAIGAVAVLSAVGTMTAVTRSVVEVTVKETSVRQAVTLAS